MAARTAGAQWLARSCLCVRSRLLLLFMLLYLYIYIYYVGVAWGRKYVVFSGVSAHGASNMSYLAVCPRLEQQQQQQQQHQ